MSSALITVALPLVRGRNPQLSTHASGRNAAKPGLAKLSVRVKRGERKGA